MPKWQTGLKLEGPTKVELLKLISVSFCTVLD